MGVGWIGVGVGIEGPATVTGNGRTVVVVVVTVVVVVMFEVVVVLVGLVVGGTTVPPCGVTRDVVVEVGGNEGDGGGIEGDGAEGVMGGGVGFGVG
jgi:hypothetical protein